MEKTVCYFELTTQDFDEEQPQVRGGFVYAYNFADAAAQIEEYYGNTICSIDKIEFTDTTLLEWSVENSRHVKGLDKY